jgi:hypothetical protein
VSCFVLSFRPAFGFLMTFKFDKTLTAETFGAEKNYSDAPVDFEVLHRLAAVCLGPC